MPTLRYRENTGVRVFKVRPVRRRHISLSSRYQLLLPAPESWKRPICESRISTTQLVPSTTLRFSSVRVFNHGSRIRYVYETLSTFLSSVLSVSQPILTGSSVHEIDCQITQLQHVLSMSSRSHPSRPHLVNILALMQHHRHKLSN